MQIRVPGSAIHPGEVLIEDFLMPKAITQKEFAKKLGWTAAKLNELIKGKRSVTVDSALALSKALRTSPEFWLSLQMHHDLAVVSKRKRRA